MFRVHSLVWGAGLGGCSWEFTVACVCSCDVHVMGSAFDIPSVGIGHVVTTN